MPRRPRLAVGGLVYHVLNRGVGRMRLFDDDTDYAAFERAMVETQARVDVRLLTYCLMPNHWHLLLWPKRGHDEDLSQFMRLLTVTHTQRWHAHRRSAGTGPVYQGRFKSFPVQSNHHLLILARYIERNPVRAGLAERAVDWPWGAAARKGGPSQNTGVNLMGQPRPTLSDWPVPRPSNWRRVVDKPLTAAELEAARRSVKRGQPLGETNWVQRTAARLGLESTLRPPGRPRKQDELQTKTDLRPVR